MLAILTALAALSLVVTFAAYRAVLRKLLQPSPLPNDSPGVSILKPLKGNDDELRENLLAFTQLDYPNYEILCGSEDPDDPALAVARSVQRENPQCAMQVLAGADFGALNPKVRVLAFLAPRARNDWILVSDSNVRPRRDYLSALFGCQERTGADLVHSVLAGVGERSIGAVLENLHMSSWVVGAVCLADASGHPCVIGKSMLMRRSRLDALGGFAAVRDVLAEDYVLGRMFVDAGHRVELSSHVLPTQSTERSLASYLNRHVRWGQLRRRLSAVGFVAELLLNPTPWLLAVLAWADARGLQLAAVGGVIAKAAGDAWLTGRLRGKTFAWTHLVWVPAKDLLTFGMWCVSSVRTRVVWRGHHLRIGPGTRLEPVARPLGTAASRA